jgi:hypothetical protein
MTERLIVGLNVAPKGAPPFSRGKQVVHRKRVVHRRVAYTDFFHQKISTFNAMARLRNAPKNTLLRDLPDKDKIKLAIQWLYENPDESPTTAARYHNIKNEKTLIKAWQREKKRVKNGRP